MHVASLSVWNVWDLPLWAWREYRAWHDAEQARIRKQLAEQAKVRGAL
jgi:hypothetical protein